MFCKTYVTIDNGGSEIRVKNSKDEILTINNNIIKVSPENFRVKNIEDPYSVVQILSAPSTLMCGIYANGDAAQNYVGEPVKFDNQTPKTASSAYYKTLIVAIANDAIRRVQSGFETGEFKKPMLSFCDALELSYVLTTLIPIREHSGQKDCAAVLKDTITGSYEVMFPLVEGMNRVKFSLDKSHIAVVPEGGVGMMALGAMISPEDISLVIDMGHITNDISVFKGKQLLGTATDSSPFAGATLLSDIRNALIDSGYRVSDKQLIDSVATGDIYLGAIKQDVSEIVSKCKERFAESTIKPAVISILNTARIPASSIKNIVPIGSPMNVEPTKVGNMAYFIQRACGLQNSCIRQLDKDLRYVNLNMAHRVCKALFEKYSKE